MTQPPDFLHLPAFSSRTVKAFFLTTSLLTFAAAAQASTVQFAAAKSYPVGVSPNAVAAADVNGDGKLDLVVSNLSGTISVLLGNGDGTFQTAHTFAAGTDIPSVKTVDLNGDAKPDIVIRDFTANGGQVGVLLNNGDGTFGPVQLLSNVSAAFSFAVGDIDGDLKPDILVGDSGTTPAVHVFRGNGDGTFQSPIDVSLSTVPGSIYLADFNLDGRPDLAVTVFNGLDVFFGNGDGTFQSPTLVGTGFASFTLLLKDLNQDGKIDIAGFFHGIFTHTTSFETRLGNGDGTFQAAISNGNTSGALSLLEDFEGDTVPDAVSQGAGSIFLWLNNGDGTFQSPVSFSAGASSSGIAAADLNNDGASDLIVTNTDQNAVSVLLNAGTQISVNSVALNPSTISRGQSATGKVVVNMLNFFVKPVTLSCNVTASGQSQGAIPSCSIQPSSVAPGANASATATLTVNSSSSLATLFPNVNRVVLSLAITCFGFLSLGRNNSAKRYIAVLAVISGLALQAACGGGSTSPPQPSTYKITVTAKAGSVQQTTSAFLTVQ
jgi:hypothetical protein